jgi:uncharacterized protein
MDYHVTTFLQYFRRYARKFFSKEYRGWIKVFRFYGVISLLICCVVIALGIYINPFPPKTVYLAIGQEGSSYIGISEKIHALFKAKGINLELIPTKGLGDGLRDLNNDASPVSASFFTAGAVSGKDYPNLVSLGSIQYAPIWILYRGETIKTNDPFEYFSNKKIAIGPRDNVTNKIFKELYVLNQKSLPKTDGFYELPFTDAANQLLAGSLDAVFIVDNFQSETVQKLISSKHIKIMNFPLADAYLKKLPYLQKLQIPKGSIDLENVLPSEDITILASTTNLLIERETHPAIQWAYLLATKDIGSSADSFFSKPGFFPRNLDYKFELSPIAKRFYEQGVPSLFSYLPLWVASLLEHIWAYVLAFIALIYPAYKLITSIRMFPVEHLMNEMFINLRELDEETNRAKTIEGIENILATLNTYEAEIYSNWLYEKNSRFYFNLKNSLAAVRRDAMTKQKELNT